MMHLVDFYYKNVIYIRSRRDVSANSLCKTAASERKG